MPELLAWNSSSDRSKSTRVRAADAYQNGARSAAGQISMTIVGLNRDTYALARALLTGCFTGSGGSVWRWIILRCKSGSLARTTSANFSHLSAGIASLALGTIGLLDVSSWFEIEDVQDTARMLRISRDCPCPLACRSAVSWLPRKELPRAETLSADSVSDVHVLQGR